MVLWFAALFAVFFWIGNSEIGQARGIGDPFGPVGREVDGTGVIFGFYLARSAGLILILAAAALAAHRIYRVVVPALLTRIDRIEIEG